MMVLMGKAFAFMHRELVLQDLNSLDPSKHHVLCALGQSHQIDEISLPERPLPPKPTMTIVTSDKDLYYETRDSINLLIFDPNKPQEEISLKLCADGVVASHLHAQLGEFGQGQLQLSPLPVGNYSITVNDEKLCSFRVVAYNLAPLVATIIHREKAGEDKLKISLRLMSYGTPVEGGVWLTLRSNQGHRHRAYGVAKDGVLDALLEFGGADIYSLDLQHADHTALTATVPLTGTSRAERIDTPLSALSPTWAASVLPSTSSTEVRGLHLTTAENEGCPFGLERVDGRTARLIVHQAAAPLAIAVIDPLGGGNPDVHHWDSVKEGQVIEFELPAPFGVVALGAFIGDEAWEGWSMTLAPSELHCDIRVPESVQAGEKVNIEIQASPDSALYLLVKDARLACSEGPEDRLASRTLEVARTIGSERHTGPISEDQALHDSLKLLIAESLEKGLLTESQAEKAFLLGRWSQELPEQILAEATELTLYEWLSKYHAVDLTDLSNVDPELARYIPEDLTRRYCCVPVARRGRDHIVLAMADPSDVIAKDDIALITGFYVIPVLAERELILQAINCQYGVTDLVEVEECLKDISCADFGPLGFQDQDLGSKNPSKAEPCDSEVLFAGWLSTEDGTISVDLPTSDSPTHYNVEVFVASERDWIQRKSMFSTEKALTVSLELPPFVHHEDQVEGRLKILTGLPPFRVQVCKNEQLLDLPEVLLSPDVLTFDCTPGVYQAKVEEILTGRCENLEFEVQKPGRVSGVRHSLQWLKTGDKICRETEPGILNLRVMDSLEQPTQRLSEVTANYAHLCCEQTAAKILAACTLWLDSSAEIQPRLESIIQSGIEREKRMFLPGKGFALYPGLTEASNYWGAIAARYLCQLELLRDCPMNDAFRRIVELGIHLGQAAAHAHQTSWPPTERRSAQECYLEIRFRGHDQDLIDKLEAGFGYSEWGKVGKRQSNCYRAAGLLRAGYHRELALKLVNKVFKEFNSEGGFYSTADSIAALALLTELQLFGPNWAEPKTRKDSGEIVSIEAAEGDAMIQVTRAFSEDWSEMESNTEIVPGFHIRSVPAGENVSLRVFVKDGYQAGDLLWVCLPKSLALLRGGGQVRRFSVDFEGRNYVDINLVALSPTHDGGETALCCLRNMFLEERIGLSSVKILVTNPNGVTPAELEVPRPLREVNLSYSSSATSEMLENFLAIMLGKAMEEGVQQVILDWVCAGVGRCRYKSENGMRVVAHYPSSVQKLLVELLEEGDMTLLHRRWLVSLLETTAGPTATLCLKQDAPDKLSWIRALSQVQLAICQGRDPDIDLLVQARPVRSDPTVDELMQVLSCKPLLKERALTLMAQLAGKV